MYRGGLSDSHFFPLEERDLIVYNKCREMKGTLWVRSKKKKKKNAWDLRVWRDPEGQDINPKNVRSARRSVPERASPVLSLMLGDCEPPLPRALSTPLP